MSNKRYDIALVKISVCDTELEAGRDDQGLVWVSVRRVCDVLGLDLAGQLAKLREKIWACVEMISTQVAGDDQRRKVAVIPLRALPMWLATINTTKVTPEIRPTLERFQQEAADVLAAYFLDGTLPQGRMKVPCPVAPPPSLPEQIDVLALRQKRALELLTVIPGLYGEDYLRHRVEHAIALVTGEKPVIENPLLSVDGYLQARGVTTAERKKKASQFGKRVKALYRERYGQDPPKQPREVNGAERPVFSYTEHERTLFDRAFEEMMTGAQMPVLDGEKTIPVPVPPPPCVELRLPPPPISPGATFTATQIGEPHNYSAQRVKSIANMLGMHGNSEFGQFKSFTNEHGVHRYWVYNQRGKVALDEKIQQISNPPVMHGRMQ